MAEYIIPNYRMEDLQKKVNRIRNKGVQVTFDVLDDHILKEVQVGHRKLNIVCSRVEIEGSYIINGWRFVGTIEHGSGGNIIRLADTSLQNSIPERYWTAPKTCEHCHINRDRNDTFLVYNEDTAEWKQVGRSCLRNYTSGLDAETCAQFVSIMNEADRLEDEQARFDLASLPKNDYLGYYGIIEIPSEEVKKKAYKYVENHGYNSETTKHEFLDALYNEELPKASDEDISNVENWLASTMESSWQHNALNAWRKEAFEDRDAGLILSAVSAYFKAKQKEAQRQAEIDARGNNANTYAGEIGDKITFTIKDIKVAYMRTGGNYYHATSYPVYKIIGTDGRVYMWGDSQADYRDEDIAAGDTLTGTIKRLNEFRGEKQTEVTRCKITGKHAESTGFFTHGNFR